MTQPPQTLTPHIQTPRILSIAGSDSSGGAGIQADTKTITMLGGYAMTAITAITAQNTVGVQDVLMLSEQLVRAQITSCVSDIGVDAVKIGMLGSPAIAQMVFEQLQQLPAEVAIVFDPVMIATSGAALADAETITRFRDIMDRATIITPNLPELAALCGAKELSSQSDIAEAASTLAARHGAHVLAKGGHRTSETIIDLLIAPDGSATAFEQARIDTVHTHGTGCTLSSAIATYLGRSLPIVEAVHRGQAFVLDAIKTAPEFGAGSGPLGHHAASAH